MQGYNVIMVYNMQEDKLLMCERKKEPYKGLNNLVGGKIEDGEEGIAAAYRELNEETGISEEDITLQHLMDFTYHVYNCYVEVYVGKLRNEVSIIEEENKLFWTGLNQDFFDMSVYAGEGNIGHMIEHVKMCKDYCFK